MHNRHALALLTLTLLAGCAHQASAPLSMREEDESAKVPSGDMMAEFHLYPTGRFHPRWMLDASRADAKVVAAHPDGRHERAGLAKNLSTTRFTLLGPQPLRDAPSDGGLDVNTGRINDFVVSPQPLQAGNEESYRAFAASNGGGVWRSENCCSVATTWTPVTDAQHIPSQAIGDLAMDPNNPNVIYAGTGDLRFGSYSFGALGLLKSTDAGNNWRVLGADVFTPAYPVTDPDYAQYQAIGKVAVDPGDSSRVVVGTKTGLFLSYDAGEHWSGPCFTNAFATGANAQRQDITALELIAAGGNTQIYAGVGTRGSATPVQPDLDRNGANGLYRASMPTAGCPVGWQLLTRPDNGWPAGMGAGQPFGPVGRLELAIAPSNPAVMYIEAIHPSTFSIIGIWRSNDAGNTWQQRATPANFGGCETGQQNWYNAGISVHPGNPEVVFLSSYWVYRSDNGGATFSNLLCTNDNGKTHIDQHARAFVGGDANRLLIGNDGGIYYTANALANNPSVVWLNDTVSSIEFYAGDLSANFATAPVRTIVGGAQDNGTSVFAQSGPMQAGTWNSVWGGDGITARIEPVRGARYYYSSQRGDMVVSTDGPNAPEAEAGGAWNPGETGPEPKHFLMPFDLYRYGDVNVANSGCTTNAGCTHLIAGTTRVWESTNGAIANTPAARFTAISADLTKGTLVLGSDRRSVITHLAYSISDRRIAMVGTQDGNVWFGFDLGGRPGQVSSWRNVTGGNSVLPNRAILKVATDPQTPTIGYAAVGGFTQNTPTTPGHVFQVRCNADCSSFSWRNVSGNLPDIPANAVIVNPWIRRQVFVGTDWGLYFTDNVDAELVQWQRFEGFPRVMIWDMQIDRGFTTLAVFTRSRGAWVWPLPRTATQPNLAGLWSTPGEGGWGISIAHQGEMLFPAWYTFDAQGRPIWHTSTPTRQADGSYLGDLFRFDGTPFQLIDNAPAYQPAVTVGSGRYTLLDDGRLRFDYSVDGISQSKTLQRIAPGVVPMCRFTLLPRTQSGNHTDIWWKQNEPGWGMYLTESGNLIFLTWYTYASDGKAMWVTGLLSRGNDGVFRGALNRAAAGTPFSQINGPATAFPVPEVGTASLSFSDGETGSFSYTLDGFTQQKSITRVQYAGPERSVCE
jgi:hypothetical protein